jgi:hypothetical protein
MHYAIPKTPSSLEGFSWPRKHEIVINVAVNVSMAPIVDDRELKTLLDMQLWRRASSDEQHKGSVEAM